MINMETSKEKICPLSLSGEVWTACVEAECAWWCGFAQDCAVPLLAGMFADSDVCKTAFCEPPYPESLEEIRRKLKEKRSYT